MALQIAERPVVGEDVEAIRRALEGASRAVAAVGAVADVGAQHLRAVVRRHPPRDGEQLIVGQRRRGVERGGDDLRLAVGIEVAERDFVALLGSHSVKQPVAQPIGGIGARRRDTATIGRRDPADRRRVRNAGMTLRSSTSISSAQARTSSSGCARMRSSSDSNAWPLPNIPTFDCVAAGSRPRSVSSALARMAARCTPSESFAPRGWRAAKYSCMRGIHSA